HSERREVRAPELSVQSQRLVAPSKALDPTARAHPQTAAAQKCSPATYVGSAGSGQKGISTAAAAAPQSGVTARDVAMNGGARVVQRRDRWMAELKAMELKGHDVSEERDALLNGVPVVLRAEPRGQRLSNTPTVRRYLTDVKKRLAEYAAKGAVEELTAQPALVQPLHVI